MFTKDFMYKFKFENGQLLDVVQIDGNDCRNKELAGLLFDVYFNQEGVLVVLPNNKQQNYEEIIKNKKILKIAHKNVEELLKQDDYDFFNYSNSKFIIDGLVDEMGNGVEYSGIKNNFVDLI